ncbi:MAG: hypothetical protein ACE5E8_00260 [Acidimicrobiia bacterium]
MSDWSWVAFGYLTTYGSLAAYVFWTVRRIRRARSRISVPR